MASRRPGTTTTLIVSPKGQITLPKPVRTRLRLAPGSVLLLREEDGKIVLDPAAVTPVSFYADEEIERLVGADRASPGERAALRRRWGLKAGAQRRRGRG
jgi:AbrB family looped-hinge helix DNA binding protein